MSHWYKHSFQRTLLDMHIEDWDERFLSEYDPDAYFHAIRTAGVDAVMIYAQSHVGLCYWPTKSGEMHRALVGREDMIRRLFRRCRAEGIHTVLYYSIIFNNRAYDAHPEWRMRDAAGRGSRDMGGRYGLCCPNNPEYRAFVDGQIQEFSDYFDYDGVFFDMSFWPEVCYCDACRRRFEREAGGMLPEIVDWSDPAWLLFNQKRHDWMGEFAQHLTAEAKSRRPGVTVEHQYANSMSFWRYGNNENVALASDYVGTDLYGGPEEQSFACKAWYGLSQNQPFQYMTSRCFSSLEEHTTTKTFDQLRQCVALTYLHHGASLLIDAVDPVGTVDMRVYEMMGRIYSETRPLKPYLEMGRMQYDVALYFDLNGKYDAGAKPFHVLDHALDKDNPVAGSMPHRDAVMGAAKCLRQRHIPYGVITNAHLEEAFRHKVLVLSDVPGMAPEQVETVKRYLREGGNVYLSGRAAPALLKEVFGLEPAGFTDSRIAYLSPTDTPSPLHGICTRKYPLILFERAPLATGDVAGDVLATVTLPYTRPGAKWSMFPTDVHEDEYVDVDGPQYPFATIHANPPGIETNHPALVRARYGEGTCLWSALPIERADRDPHARAFAGIIRMLAGDSFVFRADAPETVECVLFDAPAQGLKLIGAVETREGAHIPPAHDLSVGVRMDYAPRRAFDLLSGRDLPFAFADGHAHIRLEKIDIYAMVGIEI